MRVPLKGDISALRSFGPGGGQIWGVVHVSARAPFGVLRGKVAFGRPTSWENFGGSQIPIALTRRHYAMLFEYR